MAVQVEDGGREKIVVFVDEDLEELIPGYIANRWKDIEAIREALAHGNYEEIRSLGHKMKGSGGGYGFDAITDIGRALEEAAKGDCGEEIEKQMEALKSYLERVEVIYRS